jgi:ribonuclease E
MTKRMLIDAAHPEETRVVIVDSNRVEELDFESRNKRQLRGNVYLARVTRVEPSLQAAFIEYGGNRHGFLAFSEIHPDYYKIPEADKQALKEQEEEDQRLADEEEEKRKAAASKRKSRTKKDEDDNLDDDDLEAEEDVSDEDDINEEDETEEHDDQEDERDENLDPDDEDATDETDAEIADEQVNVASKRRKRISRRRYKIQEVIKRGQILLVQAVKEERGNKGAAMTTYLSLAGRYCVLMPNTPRGGGISRKISNGSDRKRLKSIMNNLDVPQGMGVIVRTAGAKRTKSEIGHDYEYLSRLWSDIRNKTMESSAPSLIHEEGNLVKRSIRDLYNKDISEILVQGQTAYDTASEFISMLMPSHAEFVKHYDDGIPLFLRYGAEKQIENSLDATVQLKSGGYLVIHPTEALVSVDVNSGRSTKERNIERTALRTNIEAAEELARQMRLRDLAGLIVVDFIDMDEHKNNRAVERKMKEVISKDRARIQTSRISQFGLMEISRQRRRRSLLEGSTTSCPHCSGVGRKRTVESSALAAIRAVEEFAVRGKAKRIRLKTSHDVALYLLNEKRDLLTQVDEVADVFTEVVGDDALIRPHFELEVIEKRDDKRADPLIQIERDFKKERDAAKRKQKKAKKEASEDTTDSTETPTSEDESDEESRKSSRRRSRRGRRGGRGRVRKDENGQNAEAQESDTKSDETTFETVGEAKTEKPKRGRRKAPAKSKGTSEKTVDSASEDKAEKSTRRRRAPAKSKDKPVEAMAETDEKTVETEKPKRRASTRRKAPSRKKEVSEETIEKPATKAKRTRKAPVKKAEEAVETDAKKPTRKRRAPAKKADASTEAENKEAPKPKRTRKAPAKKAPTAKTEPEEIKKPTRRRRAPTKKTDTTKVEETTADTSEVEEAKPAQTRKAPAKKPAAKKSTPKKTSTRKAPVKKTAAKSTATKKTSEKETVVEDAPKKRTRKAPAKKAEILGEKAPAPKRTRKAPEKKAAVEDPKAPPPVEKAEPVAKTPEAPAKKTKRAWWRRKKD